MLVHLGLRKSDNLVFLVDIMMSSSSLCISLAYFSGNIVRTGVGSTSYRLFSVREIHRDFIVSLGDNKVCQDTFVFCVLLCVGSEARTLEAVFGGDWSLPMLGQFTVCKFFSHQLSSTAVWI